MITYEQILNTAQEDKNILGLILLGSRGKGFENEYSDYDLTMVVKTEAIELIREKYALEKADNVDLKIYSLEDFRNLSAWEATDAWDRYSYAHVQILVDKTNGDLENLIQDKGQIPEEHRFKTIDWWIDGYINGVFRSVKCLRNKNFFGAQLEAANSMLDLLTLIFALEGRQRPFLGYAQKELEKYPLQKLPWTAGEFVAKIERVLKTADLKTQQELLIGLEKVCRESGHGHIFDDWQGKDKWAMTYQLKQ